MRACASSVAMKLLLIVLPTRVRSQIIMRAAQLSSCCAGVFSHSNNSCKFRGDGVKIVRRGFRAGNFRG